mmetsp:Transcript_104092/g.318742  ORF Transcript_104092/g.318742 Transcript_104092/m.318742 type:complete len:208 (-) Transcript_104092:447-1070(-)
MLNMCPNSSSSSPSSPLLLTETSTPADFSAATVFACCIISRTSCISSASFWTIAFFSARFKLLRKHVYKIPMNPVRLADTHRVYMPIWLYENAPRKQPKIKEPSMADKIFSLVKSTSTSACSTCVSLRRLQPRRNMIMVIRPRVDPMSVDVPVTCVVRTTAPRCIVHIAFCKPLAHAVKASASASLRAATASTAASSKTELPKSAMP